MDRGALESCYTMLGRMSKRSSPLSPSTPSRDRPHGVDMPKKRKRKTNPRASETPERGPDGRFQPGWGGGPGNPHVRRNAELQTAIRDAVDPRTLHGVIRKLSIKALEGDVGAAKLLLDRVCGKVRDAQPDRLFDLRPVECASDLPRAFEQVMRAAAAGDITADDATRFGSLLEFMRRSIETSELAARLERLEAHVGPADARLRRA